MDDGTSKSCATCGVVFLCGSRPNQRFCDRKCWRRAKARRAAGKPEADVCSTSNCLACGIALTGRNHGTRHCSDACYQRACRRERLGVSVQDVDVRGCERCGKPVKRSHWSFVRWCSSNCASLAFQYRKYHEKRPILTRDCFVCGSPIDPADQTNKKYCNKECAGRNRSPEVIFRQTHARRARLVGATVMPVPKKVLRRLRCAQCSYCPAPATTVDHVVPLNRGGSHAEGNLAPACRSCNSSKGDKLLIEWRHWKTTRPKASPRKGAASMEEAA